MISRPVCYQEDLHASHRTTPCRSCFRTLRYHDSLVHLHNAKPQYSPIPFVQLHRFNQHEYLWPQSHWQVIDAPRSSTSPLLPFLLLPYSSMLPAERLLIIIIHRLETRNLPTTNCSDPLLPLDNNNSSIDDVLPPGLLTIPTTRSAESSTIILYPALEWHITSARQLYTLRCTSISLPLSCALVPFLLLSPSLRSACRPKYMSATDLRPICRPGFHASSHVVVCLGGTSRTRYSIRIFPGWWVLSLFILPSLFTPYFTRLLTVFTRDFV